MNAELLKALLEDPILYFRTIHPTWFPTKMPWVHRGITALVLQRTDFLLNFGEERWQDEIAVWTVQDLLDLVQNFYYLKDSTDEQSSRIPLFELEWEGNTPSAVHLTTSDLIQVMMPRGISKTTLFNAINCYRIGFKLTEYTVYISETQSHANTQLGNVRRTLESNERYRELFGDLVPARQDSQKWTDDFLQTTSGVSLQARGRGGQVRGMNIDAARPDVILIDDAEDKESVATPEQRTKTFKWLLGDVEPALPRHGGRIFILGTLLHAESMMAKISQDPRYITVRFGAMLPSGKALWPWYMTEKQWLAKRQSFMRNGEVGLFYMEYQSTIHVDADNRKFRPEDWKVAVRQRLEFEAVALACDPAISEKKVADNCAFGVVGMDGRGRLHILDLYGQVGMSPRDQVDKYFELHFKWDCTFHGVEAVAYQRALIHLLQEEMHRKSQVFGNKAYFSIKPLLHGRTGKVERVEGILAPRYSAGYITHQRDFPALRVEALDWPNGKKDHLDVIAMAISLLDPVAGFAAPQETITLSKSDWREIERAANGCP